MNERITKDIKNNIVVSITVVVLLSLVIEKFLGIYQPEKADLISFQYSMVTAMYIFSYCAFSIVKKRLHKYNGLMILINGLIISNLIFIGLTILHLGSANNPTFYNLIISKMFNQLLGAIITLPLSLIHI